MKRFIKIFAVIFVLILSVYFFSCDKQEKKPEDDTNIDITIGEDDTNIDITIGEDDTNIDITIGDNDTPLVPFP